MVGAKMQGQDITEEQMSHGRMIEMTRRMLAAALALLLSLSLLIGSMGALAELAVANTPAQEEALAVEVVSVEGDAEVFSAPVDEAVEEAQATELWTEEIADAVQIAEAEVPVSAGSVAITSANFPDENFRQYVEDSFDMDMDGVLSDEERNEVYSIYVPSMEIASVKGIEYFPNLNDFTCYMNQITSLDISRNKQLERMDCSFNQLTKLNLKSNTLLSYLSCEENEIATLSVGACPVLAAMVGKTPETFSYGGDTQYYAYCDDNGNRVLVTDTTTKLSLSAGVKPTSVKLNKTGTKKLAKGNTLQLKATVRPANADQSVTWISSKKAVATVDEDGLVTAKKAGKAKITVRTSNGKKASVTIQVYNAKPTKVKISASKKTVTVGKTLKLKATLTPSYAVTTLKWSSSNKSVATVSSAGKVTGKGAGSAKITVTTANNKKATVTIKVTKAATNPVKYRALLVAQEAFNPICTRNTGDMYLMRDMLNSIKGPSGGSYSITLKKDIDVSTLFSAIDTAFSGADSNDVSLFFIATHGDSSTSDPTYAGALCCLYGYNSVDWLALPDLAAKLKTVPGKVIVILESCGSGAAVYSTYAEQNGAVNAKAAAAAAAAFDAAAIEAFADADPGLIVDAQGNAYEMDGPLPNVGDLRVDNKFYVLTASRYLEMSWGTEQGPYNYFTKWLTDGVGTYGHMQADTDYDGAVTLKEMFNYISEVGDNHSFYDGTGYYYQHVQAYPKNSTYKLFKR